MSFKIEYFDGVAIKGTCQLTDDKLKTSSNKDLIFSSNGGEVAMKSDIPASQDLSNYATKTGTETLTNKTLTNPVIAKIKNGSNTLTLPSKTGTLATTADIPASPDLTPYAKKTDLFTTATIVNLIYPVNSVMFFVSTTNPNTLYSGTTWEKLSTGKFVKLDDSGLGSTGGSSTSGGCTLTINQIPSHNHELVTTTTNSTNPVYEVMSGSSDTSETVSSSGKLANLSSDKSGSTVSTQAAGKIGTIGGGGDAEINGFEKPTTTTIGYTGGGQAHTHSVDPPYIKLCAWKRTE